MEIMMSGQAIVEVFRMQTGVCMFKLFKKKSDQRGIEHYLVDAIESFESGRFSEAAHHFEAIATVVPEHPIANLMLGRSLIELGSYEKAINALFRHLKVVPDSVEALIYLGLTYYECGEHEQAVERYEQALQLREKSVLIRENLAITRMSAGELDIAIDELVALHEDKPEDPSITELLVLALGRLGRWEAAKHYVYRLKDLDLSSLKET